MGMKIQLHDFEYTTKRSRIGSKQLRFTLTWSYNAPSGEVLALSLPGCLAQINKKGELIWSPPVMTFGDFGRKHAFDESPDLYHLVRRKLEELGYVADMKSALAEILAERIPGGDLPQVIEEEV